MTEQEEFLYGYSEYDKALTSSQKRFLDGVNFAIACLEANKNVFEERYNTACSTNDEIIRKHASKALKEVEQMTKYCEGVIEDGIDEFVDFITIEDENAAFDTLQNRKQVIQKSIDEVTKEIMQKGSSPITYGVVIPNPYKEDTNSNNNPFNVDDIDEPDPFEIELESNNLKPKSIKEESNEFEKEFSGPAIDEDGFEKIYIDAIPKNQNIGLTDIKTNSESETISEPKRPKDILDRFVKGGEKAQDLAKEYEVDLTTIWRWIREAQEEISHKEIEKYE